MIASQHIIFGYQETRALWRQGSKQKGGPEAAFGVYPLNRLEVVAGPEQEAELMGIQADIVVKAGGVNKPIGGRGPTVPEGRIQGDILQGHEANAGLGDPGNIKRTFIAPAHTT